MSLYLSLRAMTRAQLAAWHLRDPRFARQQARWRARADSYLSDALGYASGATGQRVSNGSNGLPAHIRRKARPKSAAIESTVSLPSPRAA